MIKFTGDSKQQCQAASAKLAEAGRALHIETDPAKIKEKAQKREANAKRLARKNK